jgi:cellulose synthase/poly-beta-1,6-N-acetylglucosamine synthase-like glycosyltransferase
MNGLDDRELLVNSPYTPPLSILVPAYNEEVTIVDSLKSLIALKLPRFEILIVNDGSSDNMMEVLKKELKLRRRDIPYREAIQTAAVQGLYEATCELPDSVVRMIVVDKANGGKADALNAGINASECPYVISMDADSVIDDDALLQIYRVMLERPDVAAVGGQIAVANGCTLRDGEVIDVGLPKSHLARIQIVEYLRSFTTARTALSRLNALLIVSGVFCIFRKDLLIKVGGYLTEHVRSKLVHEYAGMGSSTVCEDMEIVVRLHRYIYEKGLDLAILSMPYPICWTEVPERASDLSKQRGRWSRGFMEIMVYHREMIFNSRYGIVGWAGRSCVSSIFWDCSSKPSDTSRCRFWGSWGRCRSSTCSCSSVFRLATEPWFRFSAFWWPIGPNPGACTTRAGRRCCVPCPGARSAS